MAEINERKPEEPQWPKWIIAFIVILFLAGGLLWMYHTATANQNLNNSTWPHETWNITNMTL